MDMCLEFEGWYRHRRNAQQPARREQAAPPVQEQPVEPAAPAPVVKVFEPAPRFTEREKQPA
jgi:hypothetical protein